MLSMFYKKVIKEFKAVFKTENSRFIVAVGLKFSLISILVTFYMIWFLSQVLRLNYAFFRANGFLDFRDESVFFDFIYGGVLDNLLYVFIFHVSLFFIGTYVAWLMLRPFKNIGEYCEKVTSNVNYAYQVEEFSSYTLLTRFSEFFFEYLRESRRKKYIFSNSIPPQYSKIHGPRLDFVFLLHFGLIMLIAVISSGFFIVENTSRIYEAMIELGSRTLQDQASVQKFFSEQFFILENMTILTSIILLVSYSFLGLHLYSKVSGASFAIFSTMRSFMKGNYSSRVHLVGFSHLREYTRKINKYLDYIENNFAKAKSDK